MPFKTEIQKFLDKPIFVNNDVNCAALGERWVGAAKRLDDFVVITIGTGVGSAIVANGALIQGSGYMAGEVAYFVMDKDVLDNKENAFGEFGLYEKKISGVALSQHGYLGRVGEPEDIADIVGFLVEQGRWITGQKIGAGGGMF